jgi:hypothetical protein
MCDAAHERFDVQTTTSKRATMEKTQLKTAALDLATIEGRA